jgi:hypothetical protein
MRSPTLNVTPGFRRHIEDDMNKRQFAALAACVSLAAAFSARAEDAAPRCATPAATSGKAGPAWTSGGVGAEERVKMERCAASYNVHLVFSDGRGRYVSDIPFKVSGSTGQPAVSGVTRGPFLDLSLPPGSYRISAGPPGSLRSQPLEAHATGPSERISFVVGTE